MKKFLIPLLTIILFLTIKTTVSAYIVDRQYIRNYEVHDDFIQINESKKIKVVQPNYYIQASAEDGFTIFNPVENDPSLQEKLQKTLSSIKITNANGTNLNYSKQQTSSGNIIIKVKIPIRINYNQQYTINLSYKSYGLIIKSGALRDVYIPAFAENYVFEDSQTKETVTTNVKIPEEYGNINFTLPKTSPKNQNGMWNISFNQTQLVGQTAWIQIGTTQNYSFKIVQEYTPSTTIPLTFNTYRLVLPRDVESGPITQKIYYSNINLKPYAIEQDKDGNIIGVFRVPGIESGSIVIEGYASLTQNNSIDFKNSGIIDSIPKNIIEQSTSSAKYWESSSAQIQQVAQQLKGTETNVYKILEKTYKYVIDKIDYSDVKRFGLNERKGALATLQGGAAVCMEYSDLFIALMRAQGVPARAAFGSGYSAIDYATSSENTINHQWAEVYIPEIDSWISVDTTWGDNGPELIGGDLNHFYSHVSTIDPETPNPAEVRYYGKDYAYKERQMNVAAVESIPNLEFTTQTELLVRYPTKTQSQEIIDTLSTSIRLFASEMNKNINNFFANMNIPPSLWNILKVLILLIPLTIFLFIKISKAQKMKTKRSNILDELQNQPAKQINKISEQPIVGANKL